MKNVDSLSSNRNGFIANGNISKSSTNDGDDFWNEISDDDDDDDPHPKKQQVITQSKPVKINRSVSNTQQVHKTVRVNYSL